MKVEVLIIRCCKLVLNFGYLVLNFLVAPRVRKCKIGSLIGLVAKHMLEFQLELLILEIVVNFGEQSSPFLLSCGKHSEHRL